ncbi:hypothetical protein BDZ90DRAFT_234737 [Jaminaea rosea]|uniref:Transport protein particle component n=1 Tax=Jaminaea rosea TaxID=1569628 RepID=A0A316UHL8_9BASI|nr:hypothetical protein BDZ90DRAFT_234737 [Jaminaea rosea]PWN24786.1 hypothetical protein BDZ90DRAFT_234737 [Jaminaea rosea]
MAATLPGPSSHALPPITTPRNNAGPSQPPSSSTLITPHTLALSLPHPPHADPLVDALPYQLLLAEMPATLRHSARRAIRRRKALLRDMEEAGLAVEAEESSGAAAMAKEEEAELEARMESVGASVGANLAERLSRDRPPLNSTLDVLKFLCKDFWIALWEKQVDGLRTNHRGVYVLQDHHFKPLLRISTPHGTASAAAIAKVYLPHSVGLLRGALARLGVQATVVAESGGQAGATGASVAATTFHVRVASAGTPAGSGSSAANLGANVS